MQKDKKGKGATVPVKPECCGSPMAINQRVNRKYGPAIIYRCTGGCGTTRTIRQ